MKILLTLLLLIVTHVSSWAIEIDAKPRLTTIEGVVTSTEDGSPMEYAVVALNDDSGIGTHTDGKGRFRLSVPQGEHSLIVSLIGYEHYEQKITAPSSGSINIKLTPATNDIEGIEVMGISQTEIVNKSAYNVQAIAIGDMKNTTASLSDVLSKVNGVRIRESGGVGSDTKISLNGFSGNHVKIFIDGILQNSNGAFSLSNIPANYADRIEVYSGVAPIEFGTDALGGVINIVTKKQNQAGWDLDASYSYGSFNTHRSDVTFTHQLDNGFQYKINAYQNYSDNNYDIDNTVVLFDSSVPGWTTYKTTTELYNVERFNDTYHNEAVVAEVGYRGKKWADIATFSMNYAQYYKEVQTGSVQSVVFGDRHREGYSLIPTLQYSMNNFLTDGLAVKANVNYNYGVTLVIDTTIYNYNWLGDSVKDTSRSTTHNETTENNLNANANAVYRIGDRNTTAINYTLNSTARQTRSASGGVFDDYADPQYTTKGVAGLSHMYKIDDLFNAQAFGKYYAMSNNGRTYSTDDEAWYDRNEKNGYFGYGAATTGFFLNGFQAKLSYEKAFRLPTTTELFGDSDLEMGNVTLEPEESDNYNVNLSYKRKFNRHGVDIGGGLVYGDTKNFIRRKTYDDGTAVSINHGNVVTKGWIASFSYSYMDRFSIGGNINSLNARDNEKIDYSNGYANSSYGQRMPNEPYLYASGDGRLNFYDLFTKDDNFFITYNLFYQHDFPLNWEGYGDTDTKYYVPTQWSHDVALHYNFKSSKYNFSLECKNLLDANIYDNYSLQKAGRAIYAKVRVNFGSVKR